MLVHGFTQTLRAWDALAAHLTPHFEVVRVDLPGHGGSATARLAFDDAARAVGETGGQGAYVGYSMGGRLCLRLALDRPDLVTVLVLVGASPGPAGEDQRAQRRRADEAWAETIEREGVAAFLEMWLDRPLFASLPRDAAGLEHRRANTAAGLAGALRLLGAGAQEPVWDRLSDLTAPTLLVAGERDEKFAGLARDMAERIGRNAEVALVPGAGHAAPFEEPDAFAALAEEFLAVHHAAQR